MADKEKSFFPSGFTPIHALSGMDKKAPFLVAFSGGADSRALFDLAARYCREKGSFFYAAHVNHGIRGDEALRDRAFCMRTAERYGLEICVADISVVMPPSPCLV